MSGTFVTFEPTQPYKSAFNEPRKSIQKHRYTSLQHKSARKMIWKCNRNLSYSKK